MQDGRLKLEFRIKFDELEHENEHRRALQWVRQMMAEDRAVRFGLKVERVFRIFRSPDTREMTLEALEELLKKTNLRKS